MNEKDIIEILEDDKNYKDMQVPFEDGGGFMVYRELDFTKVASAILAKQKEIILATGKVKRSFAPYIDIIIDETDILNKITDVFCKEENIGKNIILKVVIEERKDDK